jgi:site-specific DNA recombinase
MTRCAIYARYSSDQQSPASISDQIRKCREHAEKCGWTVLDQHIYSDAAMSGSGSDRPGLQTMMASGLKKPRAFDVLLLDHLSRLSRRLVDAINMFENLRHEGVRTVSISQGIDSSDEQSDMLATIHGMMSAVYIKELAKKTHRGLEGRALKGMHTGGRVFGYNIEKLPGQNAGARLVVSESEAPLVRRIFEMFAAGTSLKNLAGTLNAERIPPPRLRKGKTIASWCPSAIRAMLRNETYAGKVNWNRSRSVKKPGSNKRTFRARPRNEWVSFEQPGLRIISPELWQRVLNRQKTVSELFAKPGAGTRHTGGAYPLSGLLKCGACGSNMIIMSGRGSRHGTVAYKYYGCGLAHNRRACSNRNTIRRDRVEASFFAGIQQKVLTEPFIEYLLGEFRAADTPGEEKCVGRDRNARKAQQRD